MIKRISLMVADIDDTLCPKGGSLMPKTREMIQKLHDHGVLFGPATGRPLDVRILGRAEEWGLGFPFDFAIGMNGGELWEKETDQIEKFYLLSKENVKKILTSLEGYDLNAIVYWKGYDEIAALRMDDFMLDSQKRNHSHVSIGGIDYLSQKDVGKIEIHLRPEDPNAVVTILNSSCAEWQVVKTFEGYGHVTLEYQDPHVNKGLALQKYCEKHHVPLEEVIAFGDMPNDISLLEKAGWGVCLLNGDDKTKAAAQDITEYPVSEDGVGRYLEKHCMDR